MGTILNFFFSFFSPFDFEFRDPDPIQVDPNLEFGFVTVFFLKFSIFTVGVRITGVSDLFQEDSDPGSGSVEGTLSLIHI